MAKILIIEERLRDFIKIFGNKGEEDLLNETI